MPKFDLEETVEFRPDPDDDEVTKKGYILDHKVDKLLGDLYAIKTKHNIYKVTENCIVESYDN